jgi:predicted RNA-binding Zn-ribbon protein involved in translation (DUF1610 family)
MKRVYFCPACGATLNPNVKIILAAVKEGAAGLLLFSPTPGNYEVIAPEELELQPGDRLDFRCPVCGKSLISRANDNFAELGFRLSNGTDGRVHFARRYGEHATFYITKEEVRSYGENADVYSNLNFFGAGTVETPQD